MHPCFIYEESLRIQVLSAQHEAGLWKRNGHSLSNQVNIIWFFFLVKIKSKILSL
jgi:hypothetical protein